MRLDSVRLLSRSEIAGKYYAETVIAVFLYLCTISACSIHEIKKAELKKRRGMYVCCVIKFNRERNIIVPSKLVNQKLVKISQN